MKMMMITKMRKTVATMHEAKFVRPDGGLCGLLILLLLFSLPLPLLREWDDLCHRESV